MFISETNRIEFDHPSWIEIARGINQTHQGERISLETSMRLFSHVHDYCSNVNEYKQENELSSDNNRISGYVRGRILYEQIESYIEAYLLQLVQIGVDKHEEDLIQFYTDSWKRFEFSSKIIDGFCGYLNKYWRLSDNTKQIEDIFTLSMIKWKKIIFMKFSEQMTPMCLQRIQTERKKEIVDNQLIKTVITHYVTLGYKLKEAEFKRNQLIISEVLDVYKEYFEDLFLLTTNEFYQREATIYINKHSTSEYLQWVVDCRMEEENRIKSYFHPSTLPFILQILDDVLIRDQLDRILDGVEFLLIDGSHRDLKLLITFINPIPNAIDRLKLIVQDHIYRMGIQAIDNVKDLAVNDSVIYINTILQVYKKYMTLIKESFTVETNQFLSSLNFASNKFINTNAVTIVTKNRMKSCELLAQFADTILLSPTCSEDIGQNIDDVITVFRYIDDKDAFYKFYWRLLGERLLRGKIASDEYEKRILTEFQRKSGYAYIAKLKKMIENFYSKDILIEQYQQHCKDQQLTCVDNINYLSTVDFSIQILPMNLWPFSSVSDFNLPLPLVPSIDNFLQFYCHQYGNRKLMWLYQYTTGELQFTSIVSTYTLQVTAYQIGILLLYNEAFEWTLQQISEKTHIRTDILIEVLDILIEKNLLIRSEDIIRLNENFLSEGNLINLNESLKTIHKDTSQNTRQSTNEDRQFCIQAKIARTMKNRKVLKENILIEEIINQLRDKFLPDVDMIQQSIKYLIDKEILKQNPDDPNILEYIP